MKCGGMMRPSLAIAPNTMTEAGFSLCMTGGHQKHSGRCLAH